jgi:hypothetical protein
MMRNPNKMYAFCEGLVVKGVGASEASTVVHCTISSAALSAKLLVQLLRTPMLRGGARGRVFPSGA